MNINILKIINNNSKLKNKKFSKSNLNIKFENFTKSDKFRIDNIISTILLKQEINDDEMNLLNEIFKSLNTNDLDILKSSTLMLMIDRVYLIKRKNEEKKFDKMFDELNNYDLKNYYEIIKNGKGLQREIPEIEQLFKDKETNYIHEVIGFCEYDSKPNIVTFFQDNNKESFFGLETLDDFNKYYVPVESKNNRENTGKEVFSFKKAFTSKVGKNSLLFRNGNNGIVIKNDSGKKIVLYKDFQLKNAIKF